MKIYFLLAVVLSAFSDECAAQDLDGGIGNADAETIKAIADDGWGS